MILDYIDNIQLSDQNEDYIYDANMTLARISQGLFWIFEKVNKMEIYARKEGIKDFSQIAICNGPIKDIPTEWLSCAFQWYAVSAYNYVRLVGWVSNTDKSSIYKYINKVIPNKLKNYRHKVAAHFALTDPRDEDNKSDLFSSIITNIVYVKGYLRAGAMSEVFTNENGNDIKQKFNTSWSLTKNHNILAQRYWPSGPLKAYQSIKLSAKSSRTFLIDWQD